jgi:hypothetical protein
MNHIRVRLTIKLNGDHTITPENLQAMRSNIERGVAANLGEGIAVDTVKVTRINEAKPQEARIEA